MASNPHELEIPFFRFLAGDLPLEDLEQWIYATPQLEEYFGKTVYLELVSFNFQQSASNYELSKLIYTLISPAQYYSWQLKLLLESLLNETQDPVTIFEKLYDLYCSGFYFLDDIGIQYVLGIDEIPRLTQQGLWNEDEFFRQRKLLDNYLAPLRDEIQMMLQALESGEIRILNKQEYSISPELSQKLRELRVWRPKATTSYARPKKEWWQFWK